MKSVIYNFIPHHASTINISPFKEENIWNFLKEYLPQSIDNKKLVGILPSHIYLEKISASSQPSKKFMQCEIYENLEILKESNISLLTVMIFFNSINLNNTVGSVRFYDNKKEGINCLLPKNDFYNVNHSLENIVVFSNKIKYQFSPCKEDRYILKIPIFYTDKMEKKDKKILSVTFSSN